MFLASCGYWGGNPQLIMNAPAFMVMKAFDCVEKNPPTNMVVKALIDFFNKASDGISRGLR